MVEEILPHLYRLEIPLPASPLKYLNSYLVRGEDRDLIIDTGLNRPECLAAMQAALAELGVDLGRTDFFVTHMHADHSGLVGRLVKEGGKVYFNRPDAEAITIWSGWEPMLAYAQKNGFPKEELQSALRSHPGYRYSPAHVPPLTFVEDGDEVICDGYRFTCIHTPGHTRGHMCLYEPEKRILVAGDHILGDITPNIQCWSSQENPLKSYLESLEKVYTLDVDLVLPGHRSLIYDARGRIDELKRHHQQRAQEVLSLIGNGQKDAFHIASEMSWDIECDSWGDFPIAQKWFATGEAIAHLRYLEEEGIVQRIEDDELITYARKN